MALSRRRFTKEFKLAAVQRLETGAPLAAGVPARAGQRVSWFGEEALGGRPGGPTAALGGAYIPQAGACVPSFGICASIAGAAGITTPMSATPTTIRENLDAAERPVTPTPATAAPCDAVATQRAKGSPRLNLRPHQP